MYVKFNTRYIIEFEADGYSTEEIEEMIDVDRVVVETNEEAGDPKMRGRGPREIYDVIEEVRTDA